MAITAALIPEFLGDEEREMLARIALDYMTRFEDMPPRSGVFHDTQTEENAWTAQGIAACLSLLPKHPNREKWYERLCLWSFRAVTVPKDIHDHTVFADGQTVSELCGLERSVTTLPDGTAENHGMVHPDYMASSLAIGVATAVVLKLYGSRIPPHCLWRRQDTYDLIKHWCDSTGSPHAVQGMDWPYVNFHTNCMRHAFAGLMLRDPDGTYLEERSLRFLEQDSERHAGRLVPREVVDGGHDINDSMLMRERFIGWLSHCYLLHRLMGPGPTATHARDFEAAMTGVYHYPHAGVLLHNHTRGITSLSWRNRTMALPCTREGLELIGGAHGSILAQVDVVGKEAKTALISTRIREGSDRATIDHYVCVCGFGKGATHRAADLTGSGLGEITGRSDTMTGLQLQLPPGEPFILESRHGPARP